MRQTTSRVTSYLIFKIHTSTSASFSKIRYDYDFTGSNYTIITNLMH